MGAAHSGNMASVAPSSPAFGVEVTAEWVGVITSLLVWFNIMVGSMVDKRVDGMVSRRCDRMVGSMVR